MIPAQSPRTGLPTVGLSPLPTTPGGSFVVYVSNPSKGIGTVMFGQQERPFQDPGFVQRLQQALV